MADNQRSLWMRTFGRNLADKNFAATAIGLMVVATLCYIAAFKEKYELIGPLTNIVFSVVGFYFGSKREGAGAD